LRGDIRREGSGCPEVLKHRASPLPVSISVRRHRLISISYISLLPCHGRQSVMGYAFNESGTHSAPGTTSSKSKRPNILCREYARCFAKMRAITSSTRDERLRFLGSGMRLHGTPVASFSLVFVTHTLSRGKMESAKYPRLPHRYPATCFPSGWNALSSPEVDSTRDVANLSVPCLGNSNNWARP
jgi:hypothetical protein